jgi:ElaB/YqjD/DUF883 family membrane-anchored ribosome-binding protein
MAIIVQVTRGRTMPDEVKKSPAVESMEQAQARQRADHTKSDLEGALEDTLLASDPVSMTITSVPAGRTDINEAERVKANPDPVELAATVVDETRSVLSDVKKLIRGQPFAALGIVGAIAFIWGATR